MAAQPEMRMRRPAAGPVQEWWPDYFGVPRSPDGSRHVEPLLHLHRPPHTWAPVWRRSALPAPPVAVTGCSRGEAVVVVLVVPLLFGPVFLATGGAAWPIVSCVLLTAAAGYLVWARRVVVGAGYLAVRRLGRYHVASIRHVTGWRVRPAQHGGVVVVLTDDDRRMRIRPVEAGRPQVNAALRSLLARDGLPGSEAIRGPADGAAALTAPLSARDRAGSSR